MMNFRIKTFRNPKSTFRNLLIFINKLRKMNFKKLSLWACGFVLCCISMSCVDTTATAKGVYASGVFVMNQGVYPSGSGSVSFFNRTDTTMTNNIYELANGGANLGSVVQSMAIVGTNAFVVVNNANKVMIVNSSDFVKTGSIDSTVWPRYFLPIATTDKAYISEYGKDTATGGNAGAIRVYDMVNKKVVKRILLKTKGANQMLLTGAKVYVGNDGGNVLGSAVDSVLSVVTANGDSLLKTIPLGAGAYNVKGMAFDINNDLWVLCTGSWDRPGSTGKLIKLHGEVVERTFDVPQGASDLVTDASKYNLYFIADDKIYTKDILNFGATPPTVWMTNPTNFKNLYGLGYDSKSGFLFAAAAGNFTTPGQIHVINPSDKSLKYSKTVGLVPSGLYFN
jgi:hypothetical protein